MALTLNWTKCEGDVWCSFDRVNLEQIKTTGVYAIWQDNGPGKPGIWVRVGQGDIAKRIGAHRQDEEITKYKNLHVTWAAVEAKYLNGVERYLGEQLQPAVGDRFPQDPPIAVNTPK